MNTNGSKDEAARVLAEQHYEVEPGLTHVFRVMGITELETRPTEPIKLLEVNQDTVPSGILPLQFGPSPASGLHYPTVIMEVTPDEYQKIQSNEMSLPHGWKIAGLIPKPSFVTPP